MKLPFQIDLTGKVAVITGGAGVLCSSFACLVGSGSGFCANQACGAGGKRAWNANRRFLWP